MWWRPHILWDSASSSQKGGYVGARPFRIGLEQRKMEGHVLKGTTDYPGPCVANLEIDVIGGQIFSVSLRYTRINRRR